MHMLRKQELFLVLGIMISILLLISIRPVLAQEEIVEAFIDFVGMDHIIIEQEDYPLKMSSVSSVTGRAQVDTVFYVPGDDIYLAHETFLSVGHITLGRVYLHSGIVYRIDILEMQQ